MPRLRFPTMQAVIDFAILIVVYSAILRFVGDAIPMQIRQFLVPPAV